jgi:hypothetical protein
MATPEVVSDAQPLDESLHLQARLLRDAGAIDTARPGAPPDEACSC